MSTNVDLFVVTFRAVRTIDQFAPVTLGATDFSADYGSAARPLGIAQRDVRSGDSVPIELYGISRCKVGAAVTRGDRLVVQSGTGFAISAASGAAHVGAPFAIALTSAASGMLASAFITPTLCVPASGSAI